MVHLLIERLVVATLILCVSIVPMLATAETKYPALFAFGDSILDTGNNNKLISIIKADYRPYGMSYNGGKPTGRFCDGKVPSDLLAAALGIKDTLPPYYKNEDLDVKELPTGVCFASGGAGYDNKTSEFVRILSLYDQLDLFKEYKGKLTESVGQQKASEIIANSLYILSSGNNDIAITYTRGKRLMPFPKYAGLLVDWTATFLKDLYALGARHVWVFSTLPLGCMPIGRATVGGKKCNELENGFALQFNTLLQQNLTSIKTTTPDFDLQLVDIFTSLNYIIDSYAQLGFESPVNCCGGKSFGLGELCSILTGTCKNSSTHVFWDFAHPSQRTYEILVAEMIKKHVPI